MKRMMVLFEMLLASYAAMADTEVVDGITWTYTVKAGKASVGVYERDTERGLTSSRAVPGETVGAITIPSKLGGYPVTSIGQYAFSDCAGLTSVTIPNSVTSIGDDAFELSGLTSITIPNSVTSIGAWAFNGCGGLEKITIPASVMSIGKKAFLNGVHEISVAAGNKYFASMDGVLFNKRMTELITYPSGKTDTHYEIPSSVTSIGDRAFYSCTGLTSVTIPNSVTSIGEYAFSNCSGLTSITIPASVKSIGAGAFSIYFEGDSFAEISVAAGSQHYTSVDGVLFNKKMTELVAYPCGKAGAHYEIPSSVTSIGDGAFYYCTGLTSITIPSSVTSIGDDAFFDCDGLTSVTIPSSITSIGDGAFCSCTGLTSITIPASVKSIGAGAFAGVGDSFAVAAGSQYYTSVDGVLFNKKMTELVAYPCGKAGAHYEIPSSVTSIGDYAFFCVTG